MEENEGYTLMLMPKDKTRLIAGNYDVKTQKPRYEIKINIFSYVREQVKVTDILLGNPDRCQWAWDIKNNSDWPAFVTMIKDGEKIIKYKNNE